MQPTFYNVKCMILLKNKGKLIIEVKPQAAAWLTVYGIM
jgi:hypothetical protein